MANINWGHLLFGFSGRINRAKWWLTVLVSIIISVLAAIIAAIVGETAGNFVSIAAFIPQFWISLAAGVKRLHDLNRTGAWLVLFYIGPVVLVIFFFVVAGVDVAAALMSGETLDSATIARIGMTGGIVLLAHIHPGHLGAHLVRLPARHRRPQPIRPGPAGRPGLRPRLL